MLKSEFLVLILDLTREDWLEVRPEVEMEDVADDGEARHPLLPRGQDGAEYLMRSPVISGQLKLVDTGSGHETTLQQVASIMTNEESVTIPTEFRHHHFAGSKNT